MRVGRVGLPACASWRAVARSLGTAAEYFSGLLPLAMLPSCCGSAPSDGVMGRGSVRTGTSASSSLARSSLATAHSLSAIPYER